MKNVKKIILISAAVIFVLAIGIAALQSTKNNLTEMSDLGSGFEGAGAPLSGSVSSKIGVSRNAPEVLDASAPQSAVATDKKIIKNGNLTLQVDKADESALKIAEIAKVNGGEVFSSNFHQSAEKIKNGSMVVKVPVANFEKTFEEIKKVASLVVRESTSGQDVTEQYTDLQSRLRNKQAEEQSIAKILEQSGKITDVLEVTRELSRVRGEIELLQGQIRLMDARTEMATISINLSEDPEVAIIDSWRPWQVAKNSVNELIQSLQGFIDFAIVLAIKIIPVLILYLLLIGILYRIGKKIYEKIKSRVKPE